MPEDRDNESSKTIAPAEHISTQAADVVAYVLSNANPFVHYVASRRLEHYDIEVVILDLHIEVPQQPVHDIRAQERVELCFSSNQSRMPTTRAIRSDFPVVPHLNLSWILGERSLCLYDQAWEDLQYVWTAASHVERVREWLKKTARGELHEPEQPLEPLMLGIFDELVLPSDPTFLTSAGTASGLEVRGVHLPNGRHTLISYIPNDEADHSLGPPNCVATVIEARPTVHGIIQFLPKDLAELAEILQEHGTDLITSLRQRLAAWDDENKLQEWQQARLVLIVTLPKQRIEDGPVESTERWAFLSHRTLMELGEDLGIWRVQDGQLGRLIPFEAAQQGRGSEILPLNPVQAFTRELAQEVSGAIDSKLRIMQVGVGALGSQLFMNLVRAGFGQWVVVDPDTLSPHNLARHELTGYSLGGSKAVELVHGANATVAGDPIAEWRMANIYDSELLPEFESVDVLLDCSASTGVARYLTTLPKTLARRASVFLNLTGTDLVVLVEDRGRAVPLDSLEAQYFRLIVTRPEVQGHFSAIGAQMRYGLGCRDLSTVLSQDLVALHAATASRALRQALAEDDAYMLVATSSEDLEVKTLRVPPAASIQASVGSWTIKADDLFVDQLDQLRKAKLPCETGGVIVGSLDMLNKVVYLVQALEAPPDSEEYPTVFIRGCDGLQQQMIELERLSGGNLRYLGEWHSHPSGHNCVPSASDTTVMARLRTELARQGQPALMLIACDCHVAVMVDHTDDYVEIRY